MDILDVTLSGAVSLLLGAVMGHSLSSRCYYWLYHKDVPVSVSRWRKRRVLLERLRLGESTPQDVGDYLTGSIKGQDLLGEAYALLEQYTVPAGRDSSYLRVGSSGLMTPSTAAVAVMRWLVHDPDWVLLVAALRAGLSPTELGAHLDGTGVVTLAEMETLAGLRFGY